MSNIVFLCGILYISAFVSICTNAQLMGDEILNEDDDYDIPKLNIPQATIPNQRNIYQRVELPSNKVDDRLPTPVTSTRHFANQLPDANPNENQPIEAVSTNDDFPTVFDYETTKDYEDSQSTKMEPDYMNPDNTLLPQATPGVTVDQFIKAESINVEISECSPDKTIIENLLKDYHKHKTPSEAGVTVWIEVWLQDMTAVNERTADFESEMYLSEIWVDHALNFEAMKPCRGNLSLSYDVLDKIWKPNTVFINSKMAHIHRSPFPNIFVLIYSNGTVWVNERIQVKGPCNMEFSSFPMDTQHCLLTLESFNYNNLEVDMRWAEIEHPLLLLKDPIALPDFLLSNYTTYLTKVQYPAGVWNELTMTFTFTRRFGYYALQAYFPASSQKI